MPICRTGCLSIILFFVAALFSYSSSFAAPVGLQCEHLVNPLGIDALTPRLTWRLDDARKGAKQTAYQLYVRTDSMVVSQRKGSIWQTAKLSSDRQLITYAGKALQPFAKYYWKVEVWDKDDKPSPSQVASFETDLMSSRNWQGAWISDVDNVTLKPAPYFRKAFDAKKKIKLARAYIAAGGLYELYLNGQKIGNHRLDPMYTRFDRRTLYVTYDVTNQLQNGKNAIGVLLVNGWYNHQSTAVWLFDKASFLSGTPYVLSGSARYLR